ncbi:MAG: HAD family acid phosphatase [Planctomycetota bacterium]
MHRSPVLRSSTVTLVLLAATGCGAHRGQHPLTMATLYAQSSAEAAASCRAVYAAARAQLDAALADRTWTAALEQDGDFEGKPPAIVLDVDETVLDNSPYEVRLIEDRTAYPEGWNAWCDQAAAEPVAGALELTRYAAERGVTVFYVTNRSSAMKSTSRSSANGKPSATRLRRVPSSRCALRFVT